MRLLTRLKRQSGTNIDKVNKSKLVDIYKVQVDTALPYSERIENYIQQIKNPYCFLCGETVVKISFKPDGGELKSKLKRYFSSFRLA